MKHAYEKTFLELTLIVFVLPTAEPTPKLGLFQINLTTNIHIFKSSRDFVAPKFHNFLTKMWREEKPIIIFLHKISIGKGDKQQPSLRIKNYWSTSSLIWSSFPLSATISKNVFVPQKWLNITYILLKKEQFYFGKM